MSTVWALLAAILLDQWLGEPRRWHPLVGFGRVATGLEARLRAAAGTAPGRLRAAGILGVALLVVPAAILAFYLARLPAVGWALQVLALYFALGACSLAQHAEVVARAMEGDDLPAARAAVGRVVSRDTTALDRAGVARAAVETVLENGNDAVFGALFWFLLLGAPGVIAFRLANTLDAMWGYKNARYLHFGWAAARFDDVLNWIPARLTALTYLLLGNFASGWRCWREQAPRWYSPNAGPVMAAGAGALQVSLGGPAVYHGMLEDRPPLGEGATPEAGDIHRAVGLVRRGMVLWTVIALGGALLV